MIDLLPRLPQYKANLHCHTVISDGKWTPEQVKEGYKSHGYSVVAYTDHELFIPHPELTDSTFVALHATEVGLDEKEPKSNHNRVLHLGLIALDPDNRNNPVWNRQKYYATYFNRDYVPQNCVLDSSPDFWREYSHEGINKMIKAAKENGFYVTYNHPEWSLESYNDYMGYEGFDALEIMNYGSSLDGTDADDAYVYDHMLKGGKRIFCNAGDDNHNPRPEGSSRFDSYGAWTMIVAEKLEYRTVTKALSEGFTYASTGPSFRYIGYDPETKKIHVEFDPCDRVFMLGNVRRYRSKFACDYDEPITSADFDAFPDDGYVRLILIDKDGKKAFSRAYFVDEFLK
ncbi:MAG: hypothetical protein MJ082_02540 [Clostridia bacterium]|nr:hypothetical protein [Clostridia bacterium]